MKNNIFVKFISKTLTLSFVFIIAFNSGFQLNKANAKTVNYLRIINEETMFYQDEYLSSPLFYLPYTYYVKVINTTDGVVHAEIYSNNIIPLDGYIKEDELYYDGLSVENPYPYINTLTSNNCTMYKDCELSIPIQYVFNSRNIIVYGKYTLQNENCYYVSYNEKLGYIKEEDILPFSYSNHPNPLTFIKVEEQEEQTTIVESETDISIIVRYAIIASLVIAGFVGLYISAKKRPKERPEFDYYRENDFE